MARERLVGWSNALGSRFQRAFSLFSLISLALFYFVIALLSCSLLLVLPLSRSRSRSRVCDSCAPHRQLPMDDISKRISEAKQQAEEMKEEIRRNREAKADTTRMGVFSSLHSYTLNRSLLL
jgi:hypothetical protein